MMSLFVSFTLTPMLCSRFLKLEPGEAGHAKSKSGFFYRLIDGPWGWFLRWSLRPKPLVVLLTIGVILSTGPIAKVMGVALIPRRPERIRGLDHRARRSTRSTGPTR